MTLSYYHNLGSRSTCHPHLAQDKSKLRTVATYPTVNTQERQVGLANSSACFDDLAHQSHERTVTGNIQPPNMFCRNCESVTHNYKLRFAFFFFKDAIFQALF